MIQLMGVRKTGGWRLNSCRVKPPAIELPAYIKSLILIFLFLISGPWTTAATAASIILRDGTVEHSDKVWESDGYVHFILKGTKDVEIRYTKQIVERIEYKDAKGASGPAPLVAPSMQPGATPAAQAPALEQHPSIERSPEPLVAPKKLVEDRIVKENQGILFYDPRRPKRYWASRQSRHTTLKSALAALASQYDRPAQWVETHMGEDNDLGSIHSNLIRQKASELSGAQASESTQPETQQLHADKLQPSDAARSTDSMGPSVKPSADATKAANAEANGVAFYDPRRPEKYWTGKSSHYQTLKDAMNALARQYHVSAEWIGAHMGDTNDLAQIHRNIQKSLAVQ
jgi:hypothetical protein